MVKFKRWWKKKRPIDKVWAIHDKVVVFQRNLPGEYKSRQNLMGLNTVKGILMSIAARLPK